MQNRMLTQAEKYARRQRYRRIWHRIVGSLACLVVLVTVYKLILPGITLEKQTICGLEEHAHTQECYEQTEQQTVKTLICSSETLELHAHTPACYDGEGELRCGYADFVVHTHDSSCWDEEGNLVCNLPEVKEHVHTENCYTSPAVEGHSHTDNCYSIQRGELSCQIPEEDAHSHDGTCYDEDGELICQLEETAGHQHDDNCYTQKKVLVCGKEEQAASAAVLSCDKPQVERHTHQSSCYDANGSLTCGKLEVQEHVHDSSCFEETEVDAEPVLICELPEHQHTETCFEAETNDSLAATPNDTLLSELSTDIAADISAVWQDATGDTAENGLINGEGFGCELKFTIPASEFDTNEASCRYQLIPDTALQIASVTGTNCTPVLDADKQVIEIQVDGVTDEVGAYTDVVCTLMLSGTVQVAENQTEATLLGQTVSIIEQEEQPVALAETGSEFTYTDATGLIVTLTLDSTSYTTTGYDLKVERIEDQTNYDNALESFTTHGQVIEEAAIYKVYLVQKDNNQTHTNLNCAYTLKMSWANGLFAQVNEDDFLDFTYCKNSGSEPTALSNCTVEKDANGNVTALTATDNYYPNSAEFMFVRSSAPNGLTAGQYRLTYNETKDAFLSDSAYSKYYNSNSPIGTAGSFHIVAFDTANLNAHTNGNVLAKNLNAGANFGTNGIADELSYIQNYQKVNASSASSTNHLLVIGSENTVDFADNGNAFSVNGTKIDKPYNLIQDKDTASAPFIDLNRVKTEISQIAGNLKGYADANLTYTSAADLSADHSKLELTTPSGVGVANYTVAELAEKLGGYVQIDGFKTGSNGTVVINVDCTGVTQINMPQARIVIDDQLQGTSEVTEFSAGKVIWNFVNAHGVTINTHLMTGIVVAPGATVNIGQNLNGTIVADTINVNAESHRTDFTGKVTEPEEDTEEGEYYVTVQKTETGYAGTALPGAEFDLYKWESNDWTKVNTGPLCTSEKGTVMLRHLDSSVAYKLVETKAPDGYVMKDGAMYFWVRTDKNQTQPNQKPIDFSGSVVEVGGSLLVANDKAEDEGGYQLPETGGTGISLYTIGGLLLIAGAGILLLYNHIKRRKEDAASS